jgi:hypothetical protein
MNVSLSDNDVEILDDDVEIFEEIIDETTGKKQIIQLWPKVGSNSGSSMEVDGKICDANHSENVILTNSQHQHRRKQQYNKIINKKINARKERR